MREEAGGATLNLRLNVRRPNAGQGSGGLL